MEKPKAQAEKSRRYISSKSPKGAADAKKAVADGKTSGADGKNTQPPITREINILDLVHQYPEAVPVLIEAGLHCIGCQLSMYDTLEQGCAIHGMDEETVDRLVKEMNERVRSFRK